MSSTSETSSDVQSSRLIGQVKWFNNKSGYGFITVNDGEHAGKDIFIHFSAIRVSNQYKYLVQGEYVEFNLVKSNTDKHEYQANDISGIRGGTLMCETRRVARPNETPVPRQSTLREQPADRSTEDAGEFTKVARRKPAAKKQA
jgi:cold shock CspA family protein